MKNKLIWLLLLVSFTLVSETIAQSQLMVVRTGVFSKDSKEIKELAAELGSGSIMENPANPVCCVWVDKLSTPNPSGDPGFVAIIDGYAEIYLTGLDAVKALVDRIKQIKADHPKDYFLPKGIITNYPVIQP